MVLILFIYLFKNLKQLGVSESSTQMHANATLLADPCRSTQMPHILMSGLSGGTQLNCCACKWPQIPYFCSQLVRNQCSQVTTGDSQNFLCPTSRTSSKCCRWVWMNNLRSIELGYPSDSVLDSEGTRQLGDLGNFGGNRLRCLQWCQPTPSLPCAILMFNFFVHTALVRSYSAQSPSSQ